MAQEISLSLEETNKLRISIGLKPIPAPSSQENQSKYTPHNSDESKEITARPKETNGTSSELSIDETNRLRASLGLPPISTETTKEGQEVNNFNEHQRESKKKEQETKLQQRLSEAKERANKRKQSQVKTIYDDEDTPTTEDWLANLGAPKAKKTKTKPANSKPNKSAGDHDLSGIKIGHKLKDLDGIDGEILTFKDVDVLQESGDELQNSDLVRQDKLEKDLREKKAADSVKFNGRGYKSLAYDDEENEDEENESEAVILTGSTYSIPQKSVPEPEQKRNNIVQLHNLFEDEEKPTQAPIKMKKLKKSKSKSKIRTKPEEQEEGYSIKPVVLETFEEEEEDEELQKLIAIQRAQNQKQKLRKTPEQIATEVSSLKRWEAEAELEAKLYANPKNGVVYNDTSDFLNNISANVLDAKIEETETQEEPILKQEIKQEISEVIPEETKDEIKQEEIQEENEDSPSFSGGLAGTLSFLKSRNIIENTTAQQQAEARARREATREAELLRIKISIEERLLREEFEQDKAFTNLPKVERAEIVERALDQRLREKGIIDDTPQPSRNSRRYGIYTKPKSKLDSYNPQIKLSYRDDTGAELDTKEAFKYLSHQFHGVGPGNARVDKKLKKIKQESESTSETII